MMIGWVSSTPLSVMFCIILKQESISTIRYTTHPSSIALALVAGGFRSDWFGIGRCSGLRVVAGFHWMAKGLNCILLQASANDPCHSQPVMLVLILVVKAEACRLP